MDNTMSFLEKLLDKGLLMPFMILTIVLIILVLFAVGFIAKVVIKTLSKKKFGLKLGDKEFNYDGGEEGEEGGERGSETPTQKVVNNIEKFNSTIVAIVNYSIENGYENCRIRQNLFDSQMRNIEGNIELILTSILNDYLTNKGQNYEVAKVLVKHALDTQVINPMRKICAADRLAERTKEKVIELNRSFVEGAFNHVKLELTRLAQSVQHAEGESGVRFTYQDDILMTALERQQDSIKRVIVSSLEQAFDDAVKFLEEVHENNKSLNTKVTNSMKQYLETTEEHEKLQKEWLIGSNETPPNRIVGE